MFRTTPLETDNHSRVCRYGIYRVDILENHSTVPIVMAAMFKCFRGVNLDTIESLTRRAKRLIVVCVLCWIFFCFFSTGALTVVHASDLKARFEKEYPEASRELQGELCNVKFSMKLDIDAMSQCPSTRTIFVKDGKRGSLVENHCPNPRGGIFGRVHLLSNENITVLFQRSKGGAFEIAAHVPNNQAATKSAIMSNVDEYAFAAFTILGTPIETLVGIPGAIKDVHRIDGASGEELVGVRFGINQTGLDIKSGEIVFDAMNSWVVRKIINCRLEEKAGRSVVLNKSIDYHTQKGFIPSSIDVTFTSQVGGVSQVQKVTHGILLPDTISTPDDDMFSTESYGVGAIIDLKSSTWRWGWIFLGTIFIAFASFVLWLSMVKR